MDAFPCVKRWQTYFLNHSLRLYNSFRFVQKVTGFRKNLTLLALGGGPAFVELCLSKYMGFKCTVVDLPHIVEENKPYYDWANFETVGEHIENYVQRSGKIFDVVMSLEKHRAYTCCSFKLHSKIRECDCRRRIFCDFNA